MYTGLEILQIRDQRPQSWDGNMSSAIGSHTVTGFLEERRKRTTHIKSHVTGVALWERRRVRDVICTASRRNSQCPKPFVIGSVSLFSTRLHGARVSVAVTLVRFPLPLWSRFGFREQRWGARTDTLQIPNGGSGVGLCT